jgi:hypothetical protein
MMGFSENATSGLGWRINPNFGGDWECEQYFAADGKCIATVECAGPEMHPYPHAFDSVRKMWVRGVAFRDLMSAKAWAERIAGLHPQKPGDDREGDGSHPIAGLDPATRI